MDAPEQPLAAQYSALQALYRQGAQSSKQLQANAAPPSRRR
jgi:hypothetical protein